MWQSDEYELVREQWIPRSVGDVAPFFEDAANLGAITPPWLHFTIRTPLPIGMQKGQRIRYRIRLFGVPLHWTTEITAWSPPHGFTDSQLSGPYASWIHEHEFIPMGGGVLMRDRVRYRMRFGILGRVAHELFVRAALAAIFDYRFRAVAQLNAAPATSDSSRATA
jgi:ligand-binding SRPBCC domain-containing protein